MTPPPSTPSGPVHFIYLGGELCWQYARAMKTAAAVHGAPVILWHAGDHDATYHGPVPMERAGEWTQRTLRMDPWLLDHPIKLANVKDFLAYEILYRYGGIYLDLDTISLRPAWDLLGEAEVCVSREYPEGDTHPNSNNTAVILAQPASATLSGLYIEAYEKLERYEETWGAIGPHLVSRWVEEGKGSIAVAPYRALNGWSYHSIGDYYENPRDPGGDVRVIHLYSSDHQTEFNADRWWP